MAGLDLTQASGILKDVYLPVVREQINNKVMLLNQIEKNTEDVEGKEAKLSLHVSRNSGVGARLEGGTLPTAGNQGYVKETVPLRTQTGRFQITVQAIEAMRSNRGAFERAVESEMKRLVNDEKRNVNRQLFGTSDGVIASATTSTTTTTINLASTTTAVQLRQLEVGMMIDIGTVAEAEAGTGGPAYAVQITAVDSTNKTITVSGSAISTDANDKIMVAGSGGDGNEQAELTGLQTIVDSTGTLFNVNPTTYPVWSSYESAVSGAPTESVLEVAHDEVDIRSGEEINLWVVTHGIRRGHAAFLTTQKRFTNTLDLKGGFKALEVAAGGRSAAMIVDRDCPSATAFGLNTDRLFKHEQTDWEFMDEDGEILSRVPNKLAYEGTIYSIFELTTDKRNAHAKLTSVTES